MQNEKALFLLVWEFITRIGQRLEPLEIIISLLTMLFAGYASFRLWKQNKHLRDVARVAPKIDNFQDNIRFYNGIQTTNPVALAMSLVPHAPTIKNDVEHFLKTMNWKMDIEELNMTGINGQEDIEKLLNALREKRHLFDLEGRTEVHLFVQGPVVGGILVGAMFDNWKPIKLYHKPTPSVPAIYQYWCPLIK